MKLCRYSHGGASRIGRVDGATVTDIGRALDALPAEINALLALGEAALEKIRAVSPDEGGPSLADVRLLAPIPEPPKILAIGLNYAAHIEETGMAEPAYPIWFNKQRTCVAGPGEAIVKPDDSDALDYEGELVAVIGRGGRYLAEDKAMDAVAGFTVGNDVSVRDWQRAAPTFTTGKGFDSHGPIGPWIVTRDVIADPQALQIRTLVNGELRQEASTGQMLRPVAEQIAFLSRHFTLEPGDLIFTGTPAGVGMGFDPPRFLKVGDTVRIEIEDIGVLENPVAAEIRGT